ncbi:MAG: cation diffusion facilitator family transporter [Chlamydiales bacterium]|nr:cation diffusion facilitator family transporter [Chlamydiales bacterium]MBY0529834.1 cation diffusion facilitator family transporter [Rhabdochlamydiaceae bacterium]
MTKFPASIPLPDSVHKIRKERRRQMVKTARRGVYLRSVIIAAELLGYVFLNSSALLLDAISSLADVASSLFLIFCIRFADKPPDRNHPFGHGRFEPIGGLQLGILLAVMGGGLAFQQLSLLSREKMGSTISPFTWLIPLGAMVLLEISYRHLKNTAKKENSPALLADAVHYRIDGINSFFAMIALLLAAYYPKWGAKFDHMGATLIAFLMIGVGLYAARNNLNQLLDRAPSAEFFEKVKTAALKVPGVLATEKLLLQIYGPDAHVSLDIEVDPSLSVDLAHKITQEVRAEIQKSWPAVRDVIVHVEPFYPGDHD